MGDANGLPGLGVRGPAVGGALLKRGREADEEGEESRRIKVQNSLDTLPLHCPENVCAAAVDLARAISESKGDVLLRVTPVGDSLRAARVSIPPDSPVLISPILEVLLNHRTARVRAECTPRSLYVYSGEPFDDVTQTPATLTTAVATAARCPKANLHAHRTVPYSNKWLRYIRAPVKTLLLNNFLNFMAPLRMVWLYIDAEGIGLAFAEK